MFLYSSLTILFPCYFILYDDICSYLHILLFLPKVLRRHIYVCALLEQYSQLVQCVLERDIFTCCVGTIPVLKVQGVQKRVLEFVPKLHDRNLKGYILFTLQVKLRLGSSISLLYTPCGRKKRTVS